MPSTLFDALSPALRQAFIAWCAAHRQRDCITDGVVFTRAGLLVGDCRCTCADHRCAESARDAGGQVYFCVTCRDARYVRGSADRLHPAFGKATPCPDCNVLSLAERIQNRRIASGVPWGWWETLRLDTMDGRTNVRGLVTGWLTGGRADWPFLVLSGRPGTGKTHAAVGAAFLLTGEDVGVYFTTTRDLLAQLRATFDDSSRRTADVLDPCKAVDCLILDDLGAERETEWTAEQLLDLVDYRWSRRRLTVITTNITRRSAPADSRLWSRVFGDRCAFIVTTDGPDRRSA